MRQAGSSARWVLQTLQAGSSARQVLQSHHYSAHAGREFLAQILTAKFIVAFVLLMVNLCWFIWSINLSVEPCSLIRSSNLVL